MFPRGIPSAALPAAVTSKWGQSTRINIYLALDRVSVLGFTYSGSPRPDARDNLLLHKAIESGSSSAALPRILSLFLTPLTSLVFLWFAMISAWGSLAVQGHVSLAGQLAAVHPHGGFAVEV